MLQIEVFCSDMFFLFLLAYGLVVVRNVTIQHFPFILRPNISYTIQNINKKKMDIAKHWLKQFKTFYYFFLSCVRTN